MKKNSIELTLQLPDFMVTDLYTYRDNDCIDIDSFIGLAMKFNLDRVVSEIPMNIACNDYEDETLPLKVNLPKEMHYRLNWIALRTQNSPSVILDEVIWIAFEEIWHALKVIGDYKLKKLMNKVNE